MWIRERLDDDACADRVIQWAVNRDYLKPIIPLVRTRVNKWSDLASMAGFFLDGLVELTPDQLQFKGLSDDETRKVYAWTLWALDAQPEWTGDSIQHVLRHVSRVMRLKFRVFLAPFFMAIAGKKSATPLFETMAILGRDLTRARIRHAIDVIKPLSGKEQKRWQTEFQKVEAEYLETGAE